MATKLRTKELRMELISLSKKLMKLRLWRYGFIIIRNRGKKKFTIYIGKKNDRGETEAICKLVLNAKSIESPQIIANKLAELGDEFLSTHSIDVVEALLSYIKNWNELLIKKELEDLLSVTPKRGYMTSWWDNDGGTIGVGQLEIDIEGINRQEFEEILSFISNLYSPRIAELLEIIMTVGLTLRQVDRSMGYIHNRPVWLAIVADPSTYKTSTLNLLKDSKYVMTAQNFTPASLLPAKNDVPPLISMMHNRVFIIPTLSEETSDKEIARKVFAALESVYDGEYVKSTGISGLKREYVDTVVIAAVTPAVWERVLPYIVNIGSRWLVYRYEIDDDEALTIQAKLESSESLRNKLTVYVSKYFDFLMDNLNYSHLKNVIIPNKDPNYEEVLKILAKLVARLRAVWRIETYYSIDEETGKKTITKEVEVLQVEAPSRAYQQLKNFVRANTLLRKSSVDKIVGLPVVDEHAIRLAAKLAIGSTTNKLRELVIYLAKKQSRMEEVSIRCMASDLGLSRGTVERLTKILRHPKVDLIDSDWRVKEPFFSVIEKYVLGDSVEDG